MSSISSLQLTTPVAGETTYVSPITDLLRYNSLAYSAFYSHASLDICNLQLYFSTDNETFTLYKEITLNNTITSTGNELIPARYFKFEIQNPDLNAMSLINVLFTAHKTATSNIDVNIGADDIVISGVSTEATQLQVKSVLETKGGNLDLSGGTICENVGVDISIPTDPINLGNGQNRFNSIQVIGETNNANYTFVLEYSRNGTSWFSDGVVNSIYNGSPITFSVSRTHLSVPFVRVKHTNLASMNVSMYYSLSRE
jgi:hypothetical protein